MSHGGDPVVSGDLADLTALLVNPLHALTQVEGVDSAIVVHINALSQGGLLHVLGIVLQQRGVGGGDEVSIGGVGRSDAVPGGDLVAVGNVPGVGQGVALVSQESLGGDKPGIGIGGLAPQAGQSVTILGGDELVGHESGVPSVLVQAPGGGGHGTGNRTVHGVSAAVAVDGDEHAGLHQLGLGDSHLGKTQVKIGDLGLGILIGSVELAQVPLVESVGSLVVVHGVDGGPVGTGVDVSGHGCLFGRSSLGGGSGGSRGLFIAGAGDQAQHHGQHEQRSHELGELFHSEFLPLKLMTIVFQTRVYKLFSPFRGCPSPGSVTREKNINIMHCPPLVVKCFFAFHRFLQNMNKPHSVFVRKDGRMAISLIFIPIYFVFTEKSQKSETGNAKCRRRGPTT